MISLRGLCQDMLATLRRPQFQAGDVVVDKWDGKRKTIERVSGNRAQVVFFEGTTLHRGSLLQRGLTLVERHA